MQSGGLQRERLRQTRVPVAQDANRDPSRHVQEAAPIHIPQDATFPAAHHHRSPVVVVDKEPSARGQ